LVEVDDRTRSAALRYEPCHRRLRPKVRGKRDAANEVASLLL
jgi:hypothetical protein